MVFLPLVQFKRIHVKMHWKSYGSRNTMLVFPLYTFLEIYFLWSILLQISGIKLLIGGTKEVSHYHVKFIYLFLFRKFEISSYFILY